MSVASRKDLEIRQQGADQLLTLSQNILARYSQRYETNRDERAVFAYMYAQMTESLAQNLLTHDVPFDNPQWIVALAEAFARRFMAAMDAIDTWLENNTGAQDAHPETIYATVPRPWADVYRAIRGNQSYVLEDMVFSMMAHISYDLPLALLDVQMEANGISHVNDYHRMNDVLANATEEMQMAVARRYTRFLASFDQFAGHYDEFFTNYGIRVARSVAWYNACRIQDPASRPEGIASIERTTAAFIKYIRQPPEWWQRLLLQVTRLLIPRRRYWP
jgi:hypothetical protein